MKLLISNQLDADNLDNTKMRHKSIIVVHLAHSTSYAFCDKVEIMASNLRPGRGSGVLSGQVEWAKMARFGEG